MTSPQPPPHPDVVLRGYRRRQVDALLHRFAPTPAALTGAPAAADAAVPAVGPPPEQDPGPVPAGEVRTAAFDVAPRGYDRHQVDDLLSDPVERLADAESRPTRG